MDDYTDDEKLWILNKLITTAKDEKELNYKVLDYCYAYKINQINNMHCDDIEIIRLDNTLEAIPTFNRSVKVTTTHPDAFVLSRMNSIGS